MLSLRMAARNISRKKSRNLLTVLAIILGTALLVGVNIATNSAMAEYTRYLNRLWGKTDIFIQYAGNAPFDEGNTSILNEIPEVEKYTSRLTFRSAPERLQQLALINNDTSKAVGIVGIRKNDYEFYSETYNVSHSRNLAEWNVVIGNEIAEKYGVELGEPFNLTIQTASKIQTFTLKAIGIFYPQPPATSFDIFVDFEKAQEMTGLEDKISVILVKLNDPTRTIEVRDLLQEKLGVEFEVLAPKIEAQQRIQSQLAGFQLGLNIMIMVALLVCGFLVFNTMFMAVRERTYEIGVLRAVGTSQRHVFIVFLEESLLLGAVGTVVGIFAGLALSNLFAWVLEQAFRMSKIDLVLTQEAITLGLLGGLLTVVGGAVYPAVSASRVNILQALRPEMRVKRRVPDSALLVAGLLLFFFGVAVTLGIIPLSLSYVDMFLIPLGLVMFTAISVKKASKILVKPVMLLTSSIGLLLSKSVTRKLLRNAVSFGMIGISLSFTIMMGGIQAGVTDAIENSVKEALGADIMLLSNQTLPISFKDNLTRLDDRIQLVTPLGFYWFGTKVFNGENQSSVAVVVIEPETFYKIIKYQFVDSPEPKAIYAELASRNETLVLPEGLARKLGVSVGDNLTVITPAPVHGPKNFTVEGIFTGAALQYIFFGNRPMSESMIISFKSESKHFHGNNEALIFFVNLKEDYKEEASNIVRLIDTAYPQYGFVEHSTTLQDLLATVRTEVDKIFSIFYLMLYFAIFISTIGIAIIMIINVTERRREIGLLRSQGMGRNQILSMLLIEACFMGILGFLVGLPSGLLLLKSATSTTTITGFWLPYIVPWSTILQALALAIAASLGGALYPVLKASRMSITRALQQR